MKLATRINSYLQEEGTSLRTAFKEFQKSCLCYVDLNFPEHTSTSPPEKMRLLLEENGLALNGVALRFRAEYINGELGNANPIIAQKALDLCFAACDYCRAAGGEVITIWLGYDGFDYSFQINYMNVWNQLVIAFQKIADYASDLQISIEYKPFQPRAYAFIDSMGGLGMMLHEINRPNIGVTLDYCHMLMKHENPAYGVDIFGSRKQLFGIHLNDGYGLNDDGLMIGTASPVKTLELLYYLRKHQYNGVIYFDTFPIIEKALKETQQNIEMIKMLDNAIEELGVEKIQKIIDTNDATEANKLVIDLLKACK